MDAEAGVPGEPVGGGGGDFANDAEADEVEDAADEEFDFGGGNDGEGVDDEFHDEGFGGVDGGEEEGEEEDDEDASAVGGGKVEGAFESFAVEFNFNFSSGVRHVAAIPCS